MSEQRTITTKYERLDVEPILQINPGDIAIEQENDWWQIETPEGEKKCRVKRKLIDEITKPEERYEARTNEIWRDKFVHLELIEDNGSHPVLCGIPITAENIQNLTLTYDDTILEGEGSEAVTVKKTVQAKFVNNVMQLAGLNVLEYDSDSGMFSLNGMFLPRSPKYIHQLQNLIFGLTGLDATYQE